MKVLMIVGSSTMRRQLKHQLKTRCWEVVEAVNGEDGLETFRNGSCWDIVVVNYELKGMAGLDTLKCLRAEGFAGLALMLVPDSWGNAEIEKCRVAGVDEVLQGPIERRISIFLRELVG